MCGAAPAETKETETAPGLTIECIRSLANDSTAGTGGVTENALGAEPGPAPQPKNAPAPKKWVSPAYAARTRELGLPRGGKEDRAAKSLCG